jgi:hypothetical protein
VSNGAVTAGGETCVLVHLANPTTAVQGVQATLVDVPDELSLVSVECTERTAGLSCSANEVAGTNEIRLVVVDPAGGRCFAAGTGPIARVCVRDKAPVCGPDRTDVTLVPQAVQVVACTNEPVAPVCTQPGVIGCPDLLGDCEADGDFDLFDILYKIDVVLGRRVPTARQRMLCDDDCDGDVDIFDVVREIDALLERLPLPLTCPLSVNAARAEVRASRNAAMSQADGEAATATAQEERSHRHYVPARVTAAQRGRSLGIKNAMPVRALELTLVPEGGPVTVVGAEATRRTRGFEVAYHQAEPNGPVKVVLVSFADESIRPGRGAVVRLRTARGAGSGQLRLATVTVVERDQ